MKGQSDKLNEYKEIRFVRYMLGNVIMWAVEFLANDNSWHSIMTDYSKAYVKDYAQKCGIDCPINSQDWKVIRL